PLTFVIALILLTLGCAKSKSDAEELKRDAVIVLDDWWNVDYIKSSCELAAQQLKGSNPYASPCPANLSAEQIVSQFDKELKLAFASENTCHGLSLLTFSPEMASAAVKSPSAPVVGKEKVMAEGIHWSLMFD